MTVANNFGDTLDKRSVNSIAYSRNSSSPNHPNNLFVDWRNNDFRLKNGSAAIGAGNAALGPIDDVTGKIRQAPYDIGSYDYYLDVDPSPSIGAHCRVT